MGKFCACSYSFFCLSHHYALLVIIVGPSVWDIISVQLLTKNGKHMMACCPLNGEWCRYLAYHIASIKFGEIAENGYNIGEF